MSERAGFDNKKVAELIEPIVDEMGFELVDIDFLSEYGRRILRISVDKEGGITLDDCAQVSRQVSDLIDIKDIVPYEYVLEVSSPGLNRPLKKERDVLRAIGKKVNIKMAMPINGRRRYIGTLKKYQKNTVYLEIENNLVPLPWKVVEKANIVYENDN